MKSNLVIYPKVPEGAFQHVQRRLRQRMVDVLLEAKQLLAEHREEYICYALNRIQETPNIEPLTVAACLRAVEFIDTSLGIFHTTLGSWIANTDEYANRLSASENWYDLAKLSRPHWIDAIVKELRRA